MCYFDVESIRKQFPTLHQKVNGFPLVYFDNGATSQKPKVVIDSITNYYAFENSNIHRGVHFLSQEATEKYEAVRRKIKDYLNAAHQEEIIFTKGTTDSINIVASSFGETLDEGDEIIISHMEHHSNIVPWQILCDRKNLVLKVIPINFEGELNLKEFKGLLNSKTRLVSITHISNTLGIINPIKDIIESAHKYNAKVLIDGAQSLQHLKIDLQELDCDFFAFSGHKIFGPTGTGVLFGKKEILNSMPPYQGGGDMIERVSFKGTTFNQLPFKFEAGTPNIAGFIGLGKAIDFLDELDSKELQRHEKELLNHLEFSLMQIKGIQIFGKSSNKSCVVSFLIDGIHPFDLGTLLDKKGIALRTGHHCTQPLMDFYEIPGTVRVSLSIYNTKQEIDFFVESLHQCIRMLK